jgi:hypothetical protein
MAAFSVGAFQGTPLLKRSLTLNRSNPANYNHIGGENHSRTIP